MNPYRCDICNKFMNPENGFYVWTPYGNSTMLEPPEREYAHIECYENLKEKDRDLIIQTSWIKPSITKRRYKYGIHSN